MLRASASVMTGQVGLAASISACKAFVTRGLVIICNSVERMAVAVVSDPTSLSNGCQYCCSLIKASSFLTPAAESQIRPRFVSSHAQQRNPACLSELLVLARNVRLRPLLQYLFRLTISLRLHIGARIIAYPIAFPNPTRSFSEGKKRLKIPDDRNPSSQGKTVPTTTIGMLCSVILT